MHTTSGDFPSAATALANAGRSFYARGWVLGTAGNFSAVLSRDPLCLAITTSGSHKGELESKDFLIVDDSGKVLTGAGKPSAETALHVAIAQNRNVGAVLHTHSVWATILSETHARNGGFELSGYEMLKGLAAVTTHEHSEWLPILENTQDYSALAREIADLLVAKPEIHGILLRRHGLYTWGRDISEARRHVEILEFLFDVAGRLYLNPERGNAWRS
ncbi:MAG TPA: methylthioribulose 1-phosphate dehydratase [Bryobacteraceae bacterium]|jgi:methylthioribulose-1-phosphate dehydratase